MTVRKYIENNIEQTIDHDYDITVHPDSWVLSNRSHFSNWIDKTFKYKKTSAKTKQGDCEEGEFCPRKSKMHLFARQDFIKDYLQYDSPYRGLLVYHGLGSGKTCSSIVAAEILMNHTDVMVMLPASLRDNFINEIMKCGCVFYQKEKRHWVFIKETNDMISRIRTVLKISNKLLKQNNGIWVPLDDSEPNYEILSENSKNQIQQQIHDMIHQRYEFKNYNGLRESSIKKMVEDKKNPFDNKTIIIDEIHNLISRIVNGRKIGTALYKLLMNAKNCKLILLSGTPIINYPHEVAYILNLLAGPQIQYQLTINKESYFNKDDIDAYLNSNEFIDDFNVDMSNKKITISLVPNGFKIVDKSSSKVQRVHSSKVNSNDVILQDIIYHIKSHFKVDISKKIYTKEYTLFPESKEEFDDLFINESKSTVKNEYIFMKRAMGMISYYDSFDTKLYPDSSIESVPVEMTDNQFAVYEKARIQERKQESSSSKKNKSENTSSQVYRFFSRAVCNFVFPETIKRPFPSKMSDMNNEIDNDGILDEIIEDEEIKEDKNQAYQKELEKCLITLKNNRDKYLSYDKVQQYSPKIKKIIENIQNTEGNVLVYSQFRTVEGLGLLGMTLETNGWSEFKIMKTNDGEWKLNMTEEELKKPSYAAFTGNNEESKIILKIFNNNTDDIPQSISKVLHGRNNLHGNIIKLLMITQSGAEGISLKNTRQVHIMEPYWNHIRIQQVIGRAIRAYSHIALPKEERNVKVFLYYSTFTERQKGLSVTIRIKDKSVTSDEYLYDIAKRKKSITESLVNMMKRASVDCALHAKDHTDLTCFSLPSNIDNNIIIKQPDISLEELNSSFKNKINKNEWSGKLLQTKKGNFLIKDDTDDVYDYDIYLESGKIVKIGKIITDEITKTKRIQLTF